MSENHGKALAAAQRAEESSSSMISQLGTQLRQEISLSAAQGKEDMQNEIAKASKILEAKVATNLDIAISGIESKTDEKIAALKQEMEDNLARIQIDSIALYERFNQNSQNEINELRQEIVSLNARADELDFDHVEIRDSFVKALIGLKGHLLANTTEFIAYREDYTEHDKKRLELFLEIEMYDEVKDFVKDFAPNFTDTLNELKSTAEQNLEIISNYHNDIDQAAALFETNHNASASAACDDADETNLHVEGDLQLTDLTIPLTPLIGNSGYVSEESE